MLAAVTPLATEQVPLADALNTVLAEDLLATLPSPPFDASAMDGYALAVDSLTGEGPWRLPVRGESRAGSVLEQLETGTAARIFTGAAVPRGADAVELQENVTLEAGEPAEVVLTSRPRSGQHIRRRGEDLAVGSLALSAGTRLGAFQLGLCAALDQRTVRVRRRPRLTLISTGDELRAPGSEPWPGSIPESNSLPLRVVAEQAGALVEVQPLARDNETSMTERIRAALPESDVLVTIGGVSVGDYDVVQPALIAAGVEIDFWKVGIKPGKPLLFGRAGERFVVGVPGNPVSAQVTFLLFVVPLLKAMQGDLRARPDFFPATLAEPLRQKPGRQGFHRARFDDQGRLVPLDNQSSGAVTSMAHAEALISMPADSEHLDAGARVEALRLRSE